MTPEELLQKKLRLAEAEMALHALLTGSKEQSVSFGAGKSVAYTQANIAELRRYINELKDEIGAAEGTRQKRGPIRFIY
jgi:hypothetical protein